MRFLIPLLVFIYSLNSQEFILEPPPITLKPKSAFYAVGLSALFPGLGSLYLGELNTARGLMGTAGVCIGAMPLAVRTKETFMNTAMSLQTAWCYGLYAAYRDVRIHNGPMHYRTKMPTDSFADLVYAPFQFSVIRKPEVWGGVFGSLLVAAGVGYLTKELGYSSSGDKYPSYIALPVAISEESLFRGFLQSSLTESTNSPFLGILFSSIAFGAVHFPNARLLESEDRPGYYAFALPFLTASGAYLGWLAYKNRSLKESVAVHMWYDFILFSAEAAAQRASFGSSRLAIQIPF